MAWWPSGNAWISLGRIDVDRMEQGAIQVGNNVGPRRGGGGGSQITLVNSAGDLSNAVVWNSCRSLPAWAILCGRGRKGTGFGRTGEFPGAEWNDQSNQSWPFEIPIGGEGGELPTWEEHSPL
jgi:hypothetical protein